ncbi:GNAT family N-acetyltransferase [Microvirga guangxiensis]|uniref:Acetyltransferase involved in cellulose biosynthesis, CelD/BcsL family n=1 Tax=Microvirga guangxiensis TaxID=549386 RepID=A0A1G5GZI4_9HYPH|nr:GNAT family N-acetyltransferase [Microvirga guangxiensis]SCY57003.1 Acetyltransferase involved in cellulose biosynthesis, CelD/BcsL family [Microvirga guangxiensis]
MTQTTTIRRVADLDELEAIGPLWKDLQDQCEHSHVLMDHRWVSAWWRHFGAGKAQHTLVMSQGRTPVGIVPLAVTRGLEAYPFRDAYISSPDDYRYIPSLRWQRIVPVRRLTFPVNIASSNVRGQMVFPQPDRNLYAAFARYAAETSSSWDVATLPGLRSWMHEDTMLGSALRSTDLSLGNRHSTREMLYVDLPATWPEFLKMRSRNFRENLKHENKKLTQTFSALGPMKISNFRGSDITRNINRLFALEEQSWKVTNEKERRLHLALDDKTRSFLRDVAERFSADDEANLGILSFGDTDAAGVFNIERGGTSLGLVLYRHEKLGAPVAIAPLFQNLFEISISRGMKRIDFNGYTRNYMKWAKESHIYSRVIFFNSKPYSQLLRAIDSSAVAMGHLISPSGNASTEQARTTP